MINELDYINKYIYDKIRETNPLIEEMEKYAQENNIPIISKEIGEYLKFILRTRDINNILEIGAAIGYSTILLANEIKNKNGILTTIEIDKDRYNLAIENIKKSKLNNINIILGDALNELDKINTKFDFIFIDASKGHYLEFFNKSYNLLNTNGIIFIDNILFKGWVCKDDYPKRYKTIIKRLREFIDYLYKNYSNNFVLLPFGDGVGLFNKNNKNI